MPTLSEHSEHLMTDIREEQTLHVQLQTDVKMGLWP